MLIPRSRSGSATAPGSEPLTVTVGATNLAGMVPNGLVAIVKRDCPTCTMVGPVLADLQARFEGDVTVYSQDDPTFPEATGGAIDDRDLETSFALDLDTVPTLLRVVDGVEIARVVGWRRDRWEECTGVAGLGLDLPDHRPGCGSRTVDPAIAAARAEREGAARLQARRVVLGAEE